MIPKTALYSPHDNISEQSPRTPSDEFPSCFPDGRGERKQQASDAPAYDLEEASRPYLSKATIFHFRGACPLLFVRKIPTEQGWQGCNFEVRLLSPATSKSHVSGLRLRLLILTVYSTGTYCGYTRLPVHHTDTAVKVTVVRTRCQVMFSGTRLYLTCHPQQ